MIKEYSEFVYDLFAWSGDAARDYAHAVLGIATEFYELEHASDKLNALEEKGDLLFFIAAAQMIILKRTGPSLSQESKNGINAWKEKFPLHREDFVHLRDGFREQFVNELLDEAKRWLAYGKPPASEVDSFCRMMFLVNRMLEQGPYGAVTMEEAQQANIAKLTKRYPDKVFKAEHALNRNLQAERTALEGGSGLA